MAHNEEKVIEIHLLDYLLVIMRWRWAILRNVVVAVIVVFLLSFLLPRKYTAVTTLLPPPEQESTSMSALLSDVKVPGITLPGKTTSADIFVEMLRSRSVGERVLQRRFAVKGDSLTLLQIIGGKSIDSGLLEMRERAFFILSKKMFMTISVEMGDAQLAADVANAYVEELDRVNREKSVSRAKNSRLYIESQLRETQANLAAATHQLAAYQSGRRAVSLDEQVKASIAQSGEIKGRIIAKEIEINLMRQSMKPLNPQVVKAEQELAELQRMYSDLQIGAGGTPPDDLFMPVADVPEVGVRLAVLMREVQVQETVWELLNSQYYQAKIEEARDTPTVQVLDRAVAPLWPSSPRRLLLTAVLGLLTGFVTIFYAFACQYARNLEARPDEKARWQELGHALRSDAAQVRGWFGKFRK